MVEKNICRWFSTLCFREHKDCGDCVIFWGRGGLKNKRLMRIINAEELKNAESDTMRYAILKSREMFET